MVSGRTCGQQFKVTTVSECAASRSPHPVSPFRPCPPQEKLRLKEEREAAEADYKFVRVDGKQEQVGNFRVEPPGLFRGRGEHPKMGKIKKRIYPRDITINIGKGCPLPKHPFPGQTWREVRRERGGRWVAGGLMPSPSM